MSVEIKGQLLLKIGDELVTLGTITMSSQVEHEGDGAIVLRSSNRDEFDRAAHDAEVKAEALREAADELCVVPDYTATQVAAELYERAEQIEKGSTDEG